MASYLDGWKQLALIKAIQFNSQHRAKNDQEALNQAFEIINFSQHIENSGGPIINYLVGENVKTIGLDRIRQLAVDSTLSESNLIQVIHELDKLGPDGEGLTNALKVEYTIRCHYLDDTAKGNPTGTTNSFFERAALSIGMKPFFSPRRTKMEFAQADRLILGNFSKSYAESMRFPIFKPKTNIPIFSLLISGNAMGKIF